MATPVTTSLTTDDVEILGQETVAKRYFEITEYRLRHRLHDGGWSDEMTREVFQRGAVCAVLAYDPVCDCLIFIEQFRVGAYVASTTEPILNGSSPWLTEIVAGVVETGELPMDVAVRELKEEANCAALDIFHIMDWHTSPGAANEPVSLYCARVDSKDAHGVHGLDHEHEDIRVFTVDAATALEWLGSGTLNNATLILALQWFGLNHEKLRQRWATSSTYQLNTS
jgi:ADP-ribose pyrophosphatase